MGSRSGNSIGLTVNEIFWAAERRRQELGEVSGAVNAIGFKDASGWTHDDIESRRSRLAALAELHDAIGGRFDQSHPWWGFRPNPLAPSDDEAIARIVSSALDGALAANAAAAQAVDFFGFSDQPDAASATKIKASLALAPDVPEGVEPSLLPRMLSLIHI